MNFSLNKSKNKKLKLKTSHFIKAKETKIIEKKEITESQKMGNA